MLGFILSLLGANPLGKLLDSLTQAHKDALDAQNDHDRIEAEVRVKALESEVAARQQATQIRLATAGFWEMRLLTFLIAAPFALHAFLVGLDTCFGFGWRIAAYPPPFVDWEGTILLSFFGVQAATMGVQAIAGALARRG